MKKALLLFLFVSLSCSPLFCQEEYLEGFVIPDSLKDLSLVELKEKYYSFSSLSFAAQNSSSEATTYAKVFLKRAKIEHDSMNISLGYFYLYDTTFRDTLLLNMASIFNIDKKKE